MTPNRIISKTHFMTYTGRALRSRVDEKSSGSLQWVDWPVSRGFFTLVFHFVFLPWKAEWRQWSGNSCGVEWILVEILTWPLTVWVALGFLLYLEGWCFPFLWQWLVWFLAHRAKHIVVTSVSWAPNMYNTLPTKGKWLRWLQLYSLWENLEDEE